MNQNRVPELQRDVQRFLGRCMLRLQQYERLMKAILASHEISGPIDTLVAEREKKVEKFSGKSLGQLTQILFQTYVVPTDAERDLLFDEKVPLDRPSMAIRSSLVMPEEHWRKTKTAIEELVALRNDLVHHLIERFDVWTEEGCVEAQRHLRDCYERINKHCEELSAWARAMNDSQAMSASFVQTEILYDLTVNGIAPDGTFDWPHTGIVYALRDASEKLAISGWTKLATAQAWLAEHHADQTPKKYGCRTLRQVLHESKCFTLEKRKGDNGQKVAWFQPRSRREPQSM